MGSLVMTLFGVIGSCVLGTAYGYATWYMPFIYINFICTFFYGVILGVFVGGGAKKGRVRNTKFCSIYGFFIGVFGLYVAWVAWIYAYSDMLLIAPNELYNGIMYLAEKGAWQIKGSTPTGIMLWLIWFVEACIIIGASTLVASGTIEKEAFCEECGAWADDSVEIAPIEYLGDASAFKSNLEQQNFSELENRKLVSEDSTKYSKLTLTNCPSCKDFHLISLMNTIVTLDKEGNAVKKESNFVENMFITSETYEKLKETVGKEMIEVESASEEEKGADNAPEENPTT